tara:strand:- start:42387 stop:43268 length:882 start_codon:yes stop_codon:yes gene_type:complete
LSKLTKEQSAFLAKHNTPISSVFDASGMGKSDYRAAMKELGKTVAIGVTPCKKGNHTMRTRSGHCIQCNPASIAFQKRHSTDGFVYVACSLRLSVIKVGLANDVKERMKSLNKLNYAGASDWECVYWVKTINAGKVEFDAHGSLVNYAAPKVYQRDGRDVHCLETFSCAASLGIQAIRENLHDAFDEWEDKRLVASYDFVSKTGDKFNRYRGAGNGEAAVPLYRSKKTKPQSDDVQDEPSNEMSLPSSDEAEPSNASPVDDNTQLSATDSNRPVGAFLFFGLILVALIYLITT